MLPRAKHTAKNQRNWDVIVDQLFKLDAEHPFLQPDDVQLRAAAFNPDQPRDEGGRWTAGAAESIERDNQARGAAAQEDTRAHPIAILGYEGMRNPQPYIAAYGQAFEGRALPSEYEKGVPNECYRNASLLVVEDPELRYAEGVMYPVPESNLGVLHAWAVDRQGQIIDNTIDEPQKARYFGVVYNREAYLDHIITTKMYGVLGGDLSDADEVIKTGAPHLRESELRGLAFNPDQPRDEAGRWTDAGGSASRTTGYVSDAERKLYDDILKGGSRVRGGKSSAADFGEEPKGAVFYHGTVDKVLEDIKEKGLVPRAGAGADTWMAARRDPLAALELISDDDRYNSVFVADNVRSAITFAKYAEDVNPGARAVILEVDIPSDVFERRVRVERIVPDEASHPSMGAFRHRGVIPPEWIKRVAYVEDHGGIKKPKFRGLEERDEMGQKFYVVLLVKEDDLKAAEFNPDQPRDEAGRWTDTGGGGSSGSTQEWKQPTDPKTGRPVPIKVKTVYEAARLIHEGKVVEVPDVKTASTLIDRLTYLAEDAAEKGEKAPDYDLCQVSVAGTNLFCAESLRNEQYPEGVPRIEMPQLGGKPVPGSEADKLPRNPWDPSEVDGSAHFVKHLESIGMKTSTGVVPASKLKASQRELVGSKVAKMIVDRTFDPAKNPIFISRDNYVVDGHHRWAAVLGRDAIDGRLGDHNMNFVRVDAPISEVLFIANEWSEKFGIQQVAGVKRRGGG